MIVNVGSIEKLLKIPEAHIHLYLKQAFDFKMPIKTEFFQNRLNRSVSENFKYSLVQEAVKI